MTNTPKNQNDSIATPKKTAKKPTPIKAGKPTKRAGVAKPKLSLTEIGENIEREIEKFDNFTTKLTAKIDRANTLIEEIRKLAAEKGIEDPTLTKSVMDTNKLGGIKTKLDRYAKELKREGVSLEQKIAIIQAATQLQSLI